MKDNENKIHLFMHPRTKERLFRPNETVWLEYLVKTFSPRIQSIILLLYILFILHPETIFLNLKFLTAMLISNWMIFKGTLHSPK